MNPLLQLPGWLDPAAPHRFAYLKGFREALAGCPSVEVADSYRTFPWKRAYEAGHRDGASCRMWLGELGRLDPGPADLTRHPFTVGELWRLAGRPDHPAEAGTLLLDAAETLWRFSGLLTPPEALLGVLHICCEFPTIPGGIGGTVPDPRQLAELVGAVWPYLPHRRTVALARLLTRHGRLRTPG